MQSIDKIKLAVKGALSENFALLYKQGRKRILVESCVIEAVYPEIFVVSHIDGKTKKSVRLSFSYTDILTKNVCLQRIS